MESVDAITERGSALWGNVQYELELFTNVTTRSDSSGASRDELTTYWVAYEGESNGDRRFASLDERQVFLEASFTQLSLHSLEPAEARERPHALVGLIGSELASLTFVRGYLQLGFDSPPLNTYVWPRFVPPDGPTIKYGSVGYLESLVGLINIRLETVDEFLDQGLVLGFANGARLQVPLDGAGSVGSEVAYFADPDHPTVWQPDESVAWIPITD